METVARVLLEQHRTSGQRHRCPPTNSVLYKLSPQEARDPLSNLPQSASIELASTEEGVNKMAIVADPRNPGILRFVQDEDAHPEGPRQTGMAP